jgi:uncharacterized membrane protein YphA (DoxX/SURF4 family)
MRGELIPYSLAAVNFLWGIASLVDPRIALHPRLPPPDLLAALHFVLGLAFVLRRIRLAGYIMSVIMSSYYSVRLKPFAPLAEPQTIGILLIALAATSEETVTLFLRKDSPPLKPINDLLLRGGIAYPFVEWGLDALRNPKHFITYISSNERALLIASPIGIENSVFLLFLLELTLATLIILGWLRTLTTLASAAILTLFMIVSGYPLAFPQNIALVAASLRFGTEKNGRKEQMCGILTFKRTSEMRTG